MIFTRDPFADSATLIHGVYEYVARRVGHGPDAEDLTSEVFERALRYRNSYDHRKGKPIVWLIGIARHCVDAHLRRKAAESTVVLDDRSPLIDPERFEDAAERRIDLDAGLAALSGRDKELLALRYGADLTAGQIAELLDSRTNAVEVRLHRALGRLRAVLGRSTTSVSGASAAPR